MPSAWPFMINEAFVEFAVGERFSDPLLCVMSGMFGELGDCLLCNSYMDLLDRMLLELGSSVGEQFPFDMAEESMFNDGWLLSEVLVSVLGGGGFPPSRLLLVDPLVEPLAEVLGVRGVETADDDELELPIEEKANLNAWF